MVFSEAEFKTFVSGGVAGMCSKTVVAPLDRLKILFQAHKSQYRNLGVWSGLKAIVKNENIFALWRGNGAQMVRIFPYSATQFLAFDIYKKTLTRLLGTKTVAGSFAVKFGAGGGAGITAVALTYPLDSIRARLAFQVTGETHYTGIIHTATSMFRNEGGILALYRGFTPTICGIFPYAGSSFYCFETLKGLCMEYIPTYTCRECAQNTGGLVLSTPSKLACGAFAGAVAQTVAYPLDVTRRRMQLALLNPETEKFSQGMLATLKLTYKENGIVSGLYRGMSINYYRACPMVAVSFLTVEKMKELLGMDTGAS